MEENMDNPLITVVVPCYNRAALIGPTIDSVQSQTYENWEMVVVDDASSDDLAAVIERYSRADRRIRLVRHNRNRGEAAARNTGIEAASGRFIALLDSDDEWLPEKLESQVAAVMAMPDPHNVFCVTQTIVKLSDKHQMIRPLHPPAPGRTIAEFLYVDGGFAQPSSVFLSRDIARRFPFREDLKQIVDHLFFIEIGAAGAAYVLVPKPLTVWHNETRTDRLTLSDSAAEWRTGVQMFFDRAGPLLSPHVRLACEARFLSGRLWKNSPIQSLKLLMQARRGGALTTFQIVMLFCRNAMPPALYNTIRHLLPPPRSA